MSSLCLGSGAARGPLSSAAHLSALYSESLPFLMQAGDVILTVPAQMSSDSQGSVKGEAAIVLAPTASASSQGPPLSPSTASKTPELPGTPVCLTCLPALSLMISLSDLSLSLSL